MRRIISAICLVAITSPLLASEASDQFFNNLKQLCGKTIQGKSVYPANKDDSFYGKTLIMTVKSCSDTELRIPFSVGKDKSRTWILTRTEQGLLFKHDHRHEDGTPDELTMYGGYANSNGTAWSQSFPADDATKVLVPKGKTNIWHLTIDKENKQFIYYLERHQKPRFKAVFDLKEKG
ncbi:MAG: hypothetical protein ACRBB6_16655 [Neptuniibacter sp.]|jgi:hypothetical protein